MLSRQFWTDFKTGIRCYRSAIPYILKNKLIKYSLLPAILGAMLWVVLITSIFVVSPEVSSLVEYFIGYDSYEFRGSGFFGKVLDVLFTLIVGLGMLAAYYFVFKYILLTILGPFLGHVSEEIEKIETGKEYPFDRTKLIRDIPRGLHMNARNFIREMPLTVLFLLCSFIPVVGVAFTFLIFVISSYFVGFNMMDYYNERREMLVGESADAIWKRKGFAFAIGAGFNLIMFVPILGVLTAPMMAVVASSIGLNNGLKNE